MPMKFQKITLITVKNENFIEIEPNTNGFSFLVIDIHCTINADLFASWFSRTLRSFKYGVKSILIHNDLNQISLVGLLARSIVIFWSNISKRAQKRKLRENGGWTVQNRNISNLLEKFVTWHRLLSEEANFFKFITIFYKKCRRNGLLYQKIPGRSRFHKIICEQVTSNGLPGVKMKFFTMDRLLLHKLLIMFRFARVSSVFPELALK